MLALKEIRCTFIKADKSFFLFAHDEDFNIVSWIVFAYSKHLNWNTKPKQYRSAKASNYNLTFVGTMKLYWYIGWLLACAQVVYVGRNSDK